MALIKHILAFLLLFFWTTTSQATVTHIQTVGATNASQVASITVNLTVTAGSALVISTGKYYPDTWAVTSDNANCSSFVHAIGPIAASGGTNQYASQWYCLNAASGSTTVTFAYVSDGSGTNYVAIVASEFGGVATASAFDVSASQAQASTTTPSSTATSTRAQASELLIGTIALVGTPTISAGTNVAYTLPTNGTQAAGSGNIITAQEYFVASSAGTDAATFGLTSSSDTATLIGTYKAAASATVVPKHRIIRQ